VIWDWASQPSAPQDTVTIAAGTSAQVPLDWPQSGANGREVATGDYWAVVTAVPKSHPGLFINFEDESPIVLAKSLPPLPRENCLGHPAAATVSGLPSPFTVTLDPGVTVPGAETTFAGIGNGGRCILTGTDPEVGVLAFTNPTSTPARWGYDLFVDVAGEPGSTPGPAYCDARFSSPVVSSGTIVVRPHGVATVTLVWPHCKGKGVPPRSGFYTLSVTATSSVGTTSSDSQIVHVAS